MPCTREQPPSNHAFLTGPWTGMASVNSTNLTVTLRRLLYSLRSKSSRAYDQKAGEAVLNRMRASGIQDVAKAAGPVGGLHGFGKRVTGAIVAEPHGSAHPPFGAAQEPPTAICTVALAMKPNRGRGIGRRFFP